MTLDPNRRHVLKWMGIQLALPLVSTVLPSAALGAAPVRKRFIGAYVPNGAYMPRGENGNWTFEDALAPLVSAGFKQNTMVLRGLFNGRNFDRDPHWQNTAAFLSCRQIEIGDPGVARCGKTVDQYVADAYPGPLRSLEIGGLYYYVHPINDHPGYSNDYLNRISWQTPDKFRTPIPDPKQLFLKVFAADSGGAAAIAYLHDRKKSVLDSLHRDATRLGNRLPGSYRPVLDSYLETVREVELGSSGQGCAAAMASPTEDFSDPNRNFVKRFELHHQLVVLAMQCGLISTATLMYGPGVSTALYFPELLGGGAGHHSCAHHGGTVETIERLKRVNRVHTGLLADLLRRLKAANLLSETLVLYGSDMSDGDIHLTENLPMLLCGEGADLKFGQEIGVREQRRTLADLHMDIFSLMGINAVTSFGQGACASTGKPLAIRV